MGNKKRHPKGNSFGRATPKGTPATGPFGSPPPRPFEKFSPNNAGDHGSDHDDFPQTDYGNSGSLIRPFAFPGSLHIDGQHGYQDDYADRRNEHDNEAEHDGVPFGGDRGQRRQGGPGAPGERGRKGSSRDETPDLFRGIASCLATNEPLDLLMQVGGILTAVDPRERNPFERARSDGTTIDFLLHTFSAVDRLETTALLHVIRALQPKGVSFSDIDQELLRRSHHLPAWVVSLPEVKFMTCLELSDPYGDASDILVGVRIGQHDVTAIVHLDHNAGSLVHDGFLASQSVQYCQRLISTQEVTLRGSRWTKLDPAAARARITEAIDRECHTMPRSDTETWPQCRAVVEWMVRLLPNGGPGYNWEPPTEEAQQTLKRKFLDSNFAKSCKGRDTADLVDNILWFASGYGPCDPLRWSPISVDIFLLDWVPRKIMAPPAYLKRMPKVLRAYIQFADYERGFDEGLSAETLNCLDELAEDYLEAISDDERPQGVAAAFAAMGIPESAGMNALGGPNDFEDFLRSRGFERPGISGGVEMPGGLEMFGSTFVNVSTPKEHYAQTFLNSMALQVGGIEALNLLSRDELADEPFDWTGIEEDIKPTVIATLDITDRCCDEMLNVEFRTACRRVLSRVAKEDPRIFRRNARIDTGAAAVVWIVAKINDLFRPRGNSARLSVSANDLLSWFGLTSSLSSRAQPMLVTLGVPGTYAIDKIGDPGLLTAATRRNLIERRNRSQEALRNS